jgi:hypothetical protein
VRQRLPGRAPLPQPQLAHAHPLAGPPAFKRYEDGLLGGPYPWYGGRDQVRVMLTISADKIHETG